MGRLPKVVPIDGFVENMNDADRLVALAEALVNRRTRRLRKEKRSRVGAALRVPKREWDSLDGLESDELFVVFMPGADLGRDSLQDLRPLLRQAIVAGCAAFETYVADKAMDHVSAALKAEAIPQRLAELPMTVGRWTDIERQFERRGWGIRRVVEEHIREISSASPTNVGRVLSMIGVKYWAKAVDQERNVKRGTTVAELERIAARRNKIAHTGDRLGQRRASLDAEETKEMLSAIRSTAMAIESVLEDHEP